MNPALLAFVPGALVGTGLAVFLLARAPRTSASKTPWPGSATSTPSPSSSAEARPHSSVPAGGSTSTSQPPGLSARRSSSTFSRSVAKFYGDKLQAAVFGFLAPLVMPFLFQLFTGQFFALPLLLSPVVAIIMWTSPDASVRARAKPRNASSPLCDHLPRTRRRRAPRRGERRQRAQVRRERVGLLGVQAHSPRVPGRRAQPSLEVGRPRSARRRRRRARACRDGAHDAARRSPGRPAASSAPPATSSAPRSQLTTRTPRSASPRTWGGRSQCPSCRSSSSRWPRRPPAPHTTT